MNELLVYVETGQYAGNTILTSIGAIEGVNEAFLIPATTNLYQLNTCQSFNGSTITATRIGVSSCVVSRPLRDENHVSLLTVAGMTCSSCVKLIETTVRQMEGINSIKVSLSQSEAFIEYQPAVTTPENLCTMIYDMGFDASIKAVVPANPNSTTTLTDRFSVVGMVCMSCVNNIETNIGKMAGVKSVNVSLDHNTATVQYYPSTITPVKLCEAIKDLGFETSPLTEQQPSSKTVTIGIEGMTCNSCVQLIEKTVGAVDGIIKITVSLDKKEAVIVYNFNTLTDEGVKNAIEDTGFEVTYIKGIINLQLCTM